jgi:hypothetical protein
MVMLELPCLDWIIDLIDCCRAGNNENEEDGVPLVSYEEQKQSPVWWGVNLTEGEARKIRKKRQLLIKIHIIYGNGLIYSMNENGRRTDPVVISKFYRVGGPRRPYDSVSFVEAWAKGGNVKWQGATLVVLSSLSRNSRQKLPLPHRPSVSLVPAS